MSLELGLFLGGMTLPLGMLLVFAEQIRAALLLRREAIQRIHNAEAPAGPHWPELDHVIRASKPIASQKESLPQKASAYQGVLDSFANDLERDIAEWESVLCDFPPVLFPDGVDTLAEPISGPRPKRSKKARRKKDATAKRREKITRPDQARIILAEEREMMKRLANTGFSSDEIALYLNLPLERVHELLK